MTRSSAKTNEQREDEMLAERTKTYLEQDPEDKTVVKVQQGHTWWTSCQGLGLALVVGQEFAPQMGQEQKGDLILTDLNRTDSSILSQLEKSIFNRRVLSRT